MCVTLRSFNKNETVVNGHCSCTPHAIMPQFSRFMDKRSGWNYLIHLTERFTDFQYCHNSISHTDGTVSQDYVGLVIGGLN